MPNAGSPAVTASRSRSPTPPPAWSATLPRLPDQRAAARRLAASRWPGGRRGQGPRPGSTEPNGDPDLYHHFRQPGAAARSAAAPAGLTRPTAASPAATISVHGHRYHHRPGQQRRHRLHHRHPRALTSNQSVTTGEGLAKTIILVSTDPDLDRLTYTVTTPPANGQLSGSGSQLTFTPNAGFTGGDSFQFTTTDTRPAWSAIPPPSPSPSPPRRWPAASR